MNVNKILFIVVASIFLLSSFSMVNATAPSDYTKDSGNLCATPTTTRFITGGPGENYNVSTLNVPVSTCVKIVFHNADTVDHTFKIDSSSSTANSTPFNIYLAGGATGNANYMTPSSSMTLKFYCAVPGHDAAGMNGNLVVGTVTSKTGGSSPGFEAIPLVLGLFVATGIVVAHKKRQN